MRISRSIEIKAPPEIIFPFVNSSRLINQWNPFISEDTAVNLIFGSVSEGVGAQWSWEGKKAGAGTATIVESKPFQHVILDLQFKKPFRAKNSGCYELVAKNGFTEVIWSVDETALIPRVISSFINLEKIIGKTFDKGLVKLKDQIENNNFTGEKI